MQGAATDGGMGGHQGAETQPNAANMFSMPLALPDGRLGGAFDAPATETAQIERNSVDASASSHAQRCPPVSRPPIACPW
jgi:hypothetical protein